VSTGDDPLTPAEARVRALLAPMREAHVPDGDALAAAVVRTARWQRPVRRALLTVGEALDAVTGGLRDLLPRRGR
jgi:hypothetical protein